MEAHQIWELLIIVLTFVLILSSPAPPEFYSDHRDHPDRRERERLRDEMRASAAGAD